MKFDVQLIVRDHCLTLIDRQNIKSSIMDLFVFVILPFIVSIVMYERCFELKDEVYNVSITFFGIFIALLLNIQVAIFSIFQRKWISSTDPIEAQVQQGVIEVRRRLLSELNANISYLILICCAALVLSLCSYVAEWKKGIAPALTVFLYGHFLFTLLMIVKRSHALFQQEYKKE